MNTRTDILNYLAKKYDLLSYLEIGLQFKGSNYNKIVCPTKTSVDPDATAGADYIMRSDKFFEHWNPANQIDLIFLDGLHHADQLQRDLYHALDIISDRGFIVMHDMLPVEEIHAKVPRESKIWNGDCYRVAFQLCKELHVEFVIVDIDHGCAVVRKMPSYNHNKAAIPQIDIGYDWEYYQKYRDDLPIVNPEQFQRWI